jgi:hypothetical protein
MKDHLSHSLANVSKKEPIREAILFVIMFYEAEGKRKHTANAQKCFGVHKTHHALKKRIHNMKASDYAAGGW